MSLVWKSVGLKITFCSIYLVKEMQRLAGNFLLVAFFLVDTPWDESVTGVFPPLLLKTKIWFIFQYLLSYPVLFCFGLRSLYLLWNSLYFLLCRNFGRTHLAPVWRGLQSHKRVHQQCITKRVERYVGCHGGLNGFIMVRNCCSHNNHVQSVIVRSSLGCCIDIIVFFQVFTGKRS